MAASEKPLGYCCCCVPIRIAILAYGFGVFWDSFLCVLGYFTDDVRLFVGGYAIWTRYTVAIIGVIGLMYSLLGILSCYDGDHVGIYRFGYFLILRFIGNAVIFGGDWWMLEDCEHYGNVLSNQEAYSPTMSAVADTGSCHTVRAFYCTWWVIDMLANLYGIWGALRLAETLASWPSYHIKFDGLPTAQDALKMLDAGMKDLGLEDELKAAEAPLAYGKPNSPPPTGLNVPPPPSYGAPPSMAPPPQTTQYAPASTQYAAPPMSYAGPNTSYGTIYNNA